MKKLIFNNKILSLIILAVIFVAALYFAGFAGYNDFGLHLLKKCFSLNGDADSILLEVLRFPRITGAIIAGSCLALSGMFMQAVSKNPLAEPYITGVSSGAGLGIVSSLLFFNGVNFALFGFFGALISAILVITLCGLSRLTVTKLILIGLSVNMFAGAVISFAITTNPDKSFALMYILSGGINTDFSADLPLICLFFVLLLLSAFLIPKVNFLRLDESFMPAMQLKTRFYKIFIILISAFLAALSVFAAGILGFVGIISPLISKMIVGHDYRWLFFVNILVGSIVILFSDFISRIIIYPMQLPLGVVVALIGAPVFAYFLLKKGEILND